MRGVDSDILNFMCEFVLQLSRVVFKSKTVSKYSDHVPGLAFMLLCMIPVIVSVWTVDCQNAW